MNSLVIIAIASVILFGGYHFYGKYLERKWGIDTSAKTPAYTKQDGVDYLPASKFEVFAHQFSSIAGAGPVTGPILASMFGWVPVLIWLIVGGVFFGAVQDFGALYASVKNEGKSMGMIIEKYIGKTGRKLFLLFCWLFTLLVIAAFSDMVATQFNGMVEGQQATYNAAAASISMLFIAGAMILGFLVKKFKLKENVKLIIGIVLCVGMLALGMYFPIFTSKMNWLHIVFLYLFIASTLPMWLLMQPRDYLTTFMLIGMIVGAVIGIIFVQPTMNLNAFNGFSILNADGITSTKMFPTLFITIACGAVSGFHSLVSSGTSSKTVKNEKDMLLVGYGSMMLECLLSVLALVVVGAVAVNGFKPEGTPFQIFTSGVAGFLKIMGINSYVANCFMTMCVSALALTSLDSVARIGRMSFQELFTDESSNSPIKKLFTNKYFATAITLIFGYMLSLGGYSNVWPLFGASNQLLSALVLIALSVFLVSTGRTGMMLYVPMAIMFIVTSTSLIQSIIGIMKTIQAGIFNPMTHGLQFVVAILLMVLAAMVVKHCLKTLFEARQNKPTIIAK